MLQRENLLLLERPFVLGAHRDDFHDDAARLLRVVDQDVGRRPPLTRVGRRRLRQLRQSVALSIQRIRLFPLQRIRLLPFQRIRLLLTE